MISPVNMERLPGPAKLGYKGTLMNPADTPVLNPDIQIQKGAILVYRVFDIAEEILLSKVEGLLARDQTTQRLKLTRPLRQALIIRNPPLRISLGETEVVLGPHTIKADLSVTVWDYGVLSILFQIPIAPGTPWQKLLEFSQFITGDALTSDEFEKVARLKVREVSILIGDALERPHEWGVYEDYAVFFFEKLSGVQTPRDLLLQTDIPALILGEPTEVLSQKAREPILESTFQYAQNDLAVIDWNAAIVVEPSGLRDITDVLEFALTHLMEVRYYDDLLDKRLGELYDAIEVKRKNIFGSRFLNLSHEANTRYIEFSEFIERVDNSLKVVGDFYLATIFRALTKRFRLPDWEQSIKHKMNLLAQVSQLLQGEVNVQRSFLLEIVIILLIAFEVFAAIFKTI